MSYSVAMSIPKTPIRWSDVLELKQGKALPFIRFYRDAGLIPNLDKSQPPPFIVRKPSL